MGDTDKDFKCPFCGSTQLRNPRETIVLNKQGEYEPQFDYCCRAQAQNRRYSKAHVDVNTREEIYGEDEIGKL